MNRWGFLFIFCLTASLLVLESCDTVSAQEPSAPYIMTDLQYEVFPDFSRIILASNEKIEFVTYELADPYRIVIDLIGVNFCELETHADYTEGLVRSIEMVETPYVQQPEGLDEFYYALDYIIITPSSKLPYTVSASKDSKVLIVDIGKKSQPQTEKHNPKPLPKEIKEEASAKETTDTEKEATIEDILFESEKGSSTVVISANKKIDFEAAKDGLDITLKPKEPTCSGLEEEIIRDDGIIKSIQIVRGQAAEIPQQQNKPLYSIDRIKIKPVSDSAFEFYSTDDGLISIAKIYAGPQPEKPITEPIRPAVIIEEKPKPEEPKIEQAPKPKPEPTPPQPAAPSVISRKELLRKIKEEAKKEGLLEEDVVTELKKEELEHKKLEASHIAEHIGKEMLKDIVVKGKGVISLPESQQISIKNSPQGKAAQEEIKWAKLKRREAFRTLFPQAKARGTHTTGKVISVDFIEEEYGVQGDYEHYLSNRAWHAYNQSKINLKVAEARYTKVENDLDLKVAEAYYNVVSALMNIRLQEDLLKEAEKILKIADARHAAELSTDLEILNVKSSYNQIQFQLATAKRDLALARFKLQQAMNLDIAGEHIELAEVDTELQFKVLDVDLYKCLELAGQNQPDIVLNRFLVESNEFGEKIAKDKESFKVDLTGFYGRADSYYETESRNLQKSWNIGVKVTKPFGEHSGSYSFSKDDTSVKVGETDRTASTSNAGEFSLFDKEAMSQKSEIEEARINRRKAENELIEARRQVELEVKEAYYDYQESILQVKNSLEKVRFHEETVKVAKSQAELNEALQSQLLEAIVKLADEKAIYVKALSDYNLALAKLNKAIGIKDYFKIE